MPKAAVTGRESASRGCKTGLGARYAASVVHAAEPDVVVVCNWPILDAIPTHLLEIPVILDQHGPHLLEREYQKFGDPEENVQSKLRTLRKADFLRALVRNKLLQAFRASRLD